MSRKVYCPDSLPPPPPVANYQKWPQVYYMTRFHRMGEGSLVVLTVEIFSNSQVALKM
jgi:hypothetical protein